ncbi:MAG: gluconeogenesis factor YvcK family protein [Fervidobacterium sp.]
MKVVVVGGGTGLSTLLKGLKHYPCDITAVVTITDEGGSSGILREELNVPPPGDIRNNLVAMANDENILGELFNYRFKNGSLNGHTVGNIILAALTKITGSFTEAISKVADILAIKGRVLPVSTEMARLVAVFDDGKEIFGETKIVEYGKIHKGRIKKLSLDKIINLNPVVYGALLDSDIIILGPGSLYTSVIANLIVPGFSDAVKQSRAMKIYISNIMTQPGETNDYRLSDHVAEIERYLGTKIDFIIHSLPPRDQDVLEKYETKDSIPVEIDIQDERLIVGRFSKIEFEKEARIRHDPFIIAKVVYDLIAEKVGL